MVCPVCDGSGKLLDNVCPLREGEEASEDEEPEMTFTVRVVQLSGQEILDKVELKGTETVSVLIDKAQNALGHAPGVDLVSANKEGLCSCIGYFSLYVRMDGRTDGCMDRWIDGCSLCGGVCTYLLPVAGGN